VRVGNFSYLNQTKLSLHTLCRYQCTRVVRVGNRYVWQGGQTENQGGQTKIFFRRFAPNFIKQMFAHPGLKPCRRPCCAMPAFHAAAVLFGFGLLFESRTVGMEPIKLARKQNFWNTATYLLTIAIFFLPHSHLTPSLRVNSLGPCTNYITLEGWGVGSRLRYICYIGVGWGLDRALYNARQQNWFMVHNAHFILTPPVVLKTDIITYRITFTVCSGADLCLQMMV